jgi:protein-S-isoprenylcysteine O-methyltransferase Ste14
MPQVHIDSIAGFFRRTPVRTFVLYPLALIVWEKAARESILVQPIFLILMIWGYLQYRVCGLYRIKHGGGGPGLETPPERLVSTGPYAYTRNPMYLGHLIFLAGLTLALRSWLGAAITLATAIWFHLRVASDEKRLRVRLGEPYLEYTKRVKRWIPGLF